MVVLCLKKKKSDVLLLIVEYYEFLPLILVLEDGNLLRHIVHFLRRTFISDTRLKLK